MLGTGLRTQQKRVGVLRGVWMFERESEWMVFLSANHSNPTGQVGGYPSGRQVLVEVASCSLQGCINKPVVYLWLVHI